MYLLPLAFAFVGFARACRNQRRTCKQDERKEDNTRDQINKQQVYEQRKRLFCPAQSISYEQTSPLLIVRGQGENQQISILQKHM